MKFLNFFQLLRLSEKSLSFFTITEELTFVLSVLKLPQGTRPINFLQKVHQILSQSQLFQNNINLLGTREFNIWILQTVELRIIEKSIRISSFLEKKYFFIHGGFKIKDKMSIIDINQVQNSILFDNNILGTHNNEYIIEPEAENPCFFAIINENEYDFNLNQFKLKIYKKRLFFLQSCSIFNGIPLALSAKILRKSFQKCFKYGDTIISKNSYLNHVYLVENGELELQKFNFGGKGKKISKGEFYGINEILKNENSNGFLRVVSNRCTLICFEKKEFLRIISNKTIYQNINKPNEIKVRRSLDYNNIKNSKFNRTNSLSTLSSEEKICSFRSKITSERNLEENTYNNKNTTHQNIILSSSLLPEYLVKKFEKFNQNKKVFKIK